MLTKKIYITRSTPSGWNPSGAASWSYYSGATDKQERIQSRSNPKAKYTEVIVATMDSGALCCWLDQEKLFF